MEEADVNASKTAADDAAALLDSYLRERVLPHPILSRFLDDAAVLASGSVAIGTWDEQSALDVELVLPDTEHTLLSADLRAARLWDPARDVRLRIEDREPFRRFPGAVIRILSSAQLDREFRFDLPIALWIYS